MSQDDSNMNRISDRNQKLLMELFAFGENSVGEIKDGFDVSTTTLHRNLQALCDAGYVEFRKVSTPGPAQSKKMYSLTDTGGEIVHALSVEDDSKPVQEYIKAQKREIAELKDTVAELRDRLESVEHHVEQGRQVDESQGFEHVSYSSE